MTGPLRMSGRTPTVGLTTTGRPQGPRTIGRDHLHTTAMGRTTGAVGWVGVPAGVWGSWWAVLVCWDVAGMCSSASCRCWCAPCPCALR